MLTIPAAMQEAAQEEEKQEAAKAASKPAKAKAKVEKEEDTTYGLVLYTDGSAQPTNPGYGGWGMHGFVYSHLPPTKGHGLSTHYLTEDGYTERSTWAKMNKGKDKPQEIKPLSYINGFGSFSDQVSNNVAEAAGVAAGLAVAAEHGILKKVLIKTDSKYAVQGTTDWLPIWKRNNWYKSDGSPVANRSTWEAVDRNLQRLLDKGVEVEVRWVKGHADHLGNETADKNADYGAFTSMRHELRSTVDKQVAEGYWSKKVEKHPFFSQRRIYFSTNPAVNKPGEYYLGEHGKDDELVGKRTADGCHSYIKLKEPDQLVELLRRYQCDIANGADSIILGRLDKLFEAGVSNDILTYGNIALVKADKKRLDLNFADGEPITKEAKPPRLAMRAITALNTLQGVFEVWQSGGNAEMSATDITSLFYEKNDKGQCTLLPKFTVGFSELPITASYGKDNAKKEDKINLTLGVDLPDRNALKRLEKLDPKVIVVTWMESDKAFRYATIVSAGDDIGIWAGMHSNLRVII